MSNQVVNGNYLKKILSASRRPSILFIIHHVQNRRHICMQELLAQNIKNRRWTWIQRQRLKVYVGGIKFVIFEKC